jgi:hypothetical protein
METRIKSFTQYLGQQNNISDNLLYHVENNLSIVESVFRPGSKAHIELLEEARFLLENESIILDPLEAKLLTETDLGKTALFEGVEVPLDLVLEKEESKKLNYPRRNSGGKKKYYVYVRKPDTGNIVKVEFGDVHGGLTAKVSNPKARKSFAARHNCKDKKDKTKPGYWACRINRYAHLWGGKTYPGFW